MAEMSDYWLYSMNAPFGRTRGGEPDSPYNGFCTVFESRVMSRSAGRNLEAPCLASGAPGLDAGRRARHGRACARHVEG